jgi:poly-gamma-glutamate synthesis protein (capsule biosynthesis protein)
MVLQNVRWQNDRKINMVKIIITGDFCPHQRIENLAVEGNYDLIYNDVYHFLLDKDLSITNLECPLTEIRNQIHKIGPHLSARPECITAIKYAGFDIVTLANNHMMDQGEQGLMDTKSLCSSVGIKAVGAGIDMDDASKPLRLQIKDTKFSIINVTEHEFSIAGTNKAGSNPLDPVKNYYQILSEKKKSDFVLVVVHGGLEHFHYPTLEMVANYRFFVDVGASAVIAHHTHAVSGYEIYKGVPIFYGLGNFLFDWPDHPKKSWYEGIVVKFYVSHETAKFDILPVEQCKSKLGVRCMKGSEKDIFFKRLDEYSSALKDLRVLEKKWLKHYRETANAILAKLGSRNRIQKKLIQYGAWPNPLKNKTKLLSLLNQFECESLRNLAIGAMKTEL